MAGQIMALQTVIAPFFPSSSERQSTKAMSFTRFTRLRV